MSAPIVATGVSTHPSTEGSHVVLALHDASGAPLVMVLMTPAEAEAVMARIGSACDAVAPDALGRPVSMAVN